MVLSLHSSRQTRRIGVIRVASDGKPEGITLEKVSTFFRFDSVVVSTQRLNSTYVCRVVQSRLLRSNAGLFCHQFVECRHSC